MKNELTQAPFNFDPEALVNGDIIADIRFGEVAQLHKEGEFSLTEFLPSHTTVSLWIRRQAANAVLKLDQKGDWQIDENGICYLLGQPTEVMLAVDQWYHLALVRNDSQLLCHINSERCGFIDFPDTAPGPVLLMSTDSGSIAIARPLCYEYLLNDVEIHSDFRSGLPTIQESFASAQPIDVALFHAEAGPFAGYPEDKLLIVDAMGKERMFQDLVLTNIDNRAIRILGIPGKEATPENHHFELKFRNGVISQIKEALTFHELDDWIISRPLQNLEDRSWSVFFTAEVDIEWSAGESWTFPFSYRTADGALGERGTHVLLRYKNMRMEEGGLLKGDRTRQVDILNLSSNNQYITQMSEQVTLTDQKIDDMENRTADELKKLKANLSQGQQTNGVKQAESLGDILSLVNERLNLLDKEVDERASTTNKRIEEMEAGGPVRVSVELPQGMVCGKKDNTFKIYLNNRTDKEIEFEDSGELSISIPYGKKTSDLAVNAGHCGNSNPTNGLADTLKFQVYKWSLAGEKWAPGQSLGYTFNEVSPNDQTGQVIIPVVLTGMKGSQTQSLEAKIEKTTHDIASFVGGGNVGIGTNHRHPDERLEVEGIVKAKGFKGHGIVPVGTVIDWFRPSKETPVPNGWRIANGAVVHLKDETVDKSLRGKVLPNLNGRFVRGVTSNSASGATYGGRDSHSHSHGLYNGYAGAHNHKWLDMSGKTVRSFRSSGSSGYGFTWNNGHDTKGSGQYSVTWKSGGWEDRYTDNEGYHRHTIHGSIKSKSNVPAYVGLLKLIRVI